MPGAVPQAGQDLAQQERLQRVRLQRRVGGIGIQDAAAQLSPQPREQVGFAGAAHAAHEAHLRAAVGVHQIHRLPQLRGLAGVNLRHIKPGARAP